MKEVEFYFNKYHREFFTESEMPEQLEKMGRYLERTMGLQAKFLLSLETEEVQSQWLLRLARHETLSFKIVTDSPTEFYYNPYETRVMSVEEYDRLAEKIYQEKSSNRLEFQEWLNNEYCAMDIWRIVGNPEGKQSFLNRFNEYCRYEAENYVLEDWEPVTIKQEE